MAIGDLWDVAQEIADEVVDHFSTLYPHIRMNRAEWSDLHEMIEREVYGHFSEGEKEREVRAVDLLEAKRALCGSPRPS
jgi:hypothetical protein